MASFTSDIRRELLSAGTGARFAVLAELNALILTSGSADENSFSFTGEDERVAERFLMLVDKAFGVSLTVTEAAVDPMQGRDKLTFTYNGPRAAEYLAEISGYGADMLTDDGERVAYLRGAFLGGGSCTLPHSGARTGYHLEVVFPTEADALAFCDMLDKMQLLANVVRRGDKYVCYLKHHESIGDFLFVAGAEGAVRTLEAVSAAREESNNENRVGNCFARNADKTAIASTAQVIALGRLSKGELENLPAPLRAVAEARLAHPELAMRELADLLGVTKSCLNHRLRKLIAICGAEYNGKNGGPK